MADIIPPNPQQPITVEVPQKGIMEQVFRAWTQAITRTVQSLQNEIDGGGA
jgi:hypothetical protein